MTNRGDGMKTFKGLTFGEGRISKEEGKSPKGLGPRELKGKLKAPRPSLVHLLVWEPPLR